MNEYLPILWLIITVGLVVLEASTYQLVAIWFAIGGLFAMLAAVFGLLFGVLCAPVYVVSGGVSFAVAWWIEGIPFDLLHCAGNFVMALVLFLPLKKLLTRLYLKV